MQTPLGMTVLYVALFPGFIEFMVEINETLGMTVLYVALFPAFYRIHGGDKVWK